MISTENLFPTSYRLVGVTSVEEFEAQETYDIEVSEVHAFNARNEKSGATSVSHNSAMISLFDLTDEAMLTCKFGNWWETNAQRGRSNNSAVILRHKVEKEDFLALWKKIEMSNSGEPGFFFSNDMEWGANPCITGDALITVKDHDATTDGTIVAEGGVYQIPLKHLVELYNSTTYPPMVLSYDTDLKQLEWDILDAAELTREKASIIELMLESGETIKMTPDHKVYTENRGWIEAAQLNEDDVLITIN